MIGDQADFVLRLRALLPSRWFPLTQEGQPSATPVLDGLLNGFAWMLSQAYALIAYVNLQTRIATATDIFLDIIALDFFGATLARKSNEADATFSARIRANLLPRGGTRAAISLALTNLTGRAPQIFEPWNPGDAGGYASAASGALTDIPLVASYVQSGWTLGAPVSGPASGVMGRYLTTSVAGTTNALVIPLTGQIASVLLYVLTPVSSGIDVIIEVNGNRVVGAFFTNGFWKQISVSVQALNPVITIQGYSAFVNASFLISDLFVPVPGPASYSGMAYGVAGGWGSLALPAQAFITAFRQIEGGVANVAGYSGQESSPAYAPGGYGVGAIEYVTLDQAGTQIEDAEIFAAVARTQAEGVRCWTKISN